MRQTSAKAHQTNRLWCVQCAVDSNAVYMICLTTMVPITVFLADDAEVVRSAIRKMLEIEPLIALVGEAGSFAEAIRMAADLKPNVMVIDLHMPDEGPLDPASVKAQMTASASRVLAISVWNDEESKALANSYGAKVLLDKARLGLELVPAILSYGQDIASH
jgi:DNA-binding NarL/FixJ family response regulator